MTATKAKFAPTGTGLYPTFVALMAVVLILSNIGASKPVTFGSIVTDGGFFLFPLAYIIGDVVSEVYGWKASRRAVIVTFSLSVFAALCYWIMIALPGADFYDGQDALVRTLGPVWQIVVASLLGFLAGQLSNAFTMVRMKKRSGEKMLSDAWRPPPSSANSLIRSSSAYSQPRYSESQTSQRSSTTYL